MVNVSSVENGNESMRVSGVKNGSVSATATVNMGGIEDVGHVDQVILIRDETHRGQPMMQLVWISKPRLGQQVGPLPVFGREPPYLPW